MAIEISCNALSLSLVSLSCLSFVSGASELCQSAQLASFFAAKTVLDKKKRLRRANDANQVKCHGQEQSVVCCERGTACSKDNREIISIAMSSPPYSSDAKENSVEKRTTSSPAKGSNTPSGKPKLRSGYSSSLLQRVRQASHMSRAKQEEANREKEKNQKRSGSKRRTKDSDLKPQEADHERPDSRVGG